MPFPAIGRVGLAGAPHQGAVKRTVQERGECHAKTRHFRHSLTFRNSIL